MANTITGKALVVGKTLNVSREKEFLKRELVLDASRYDEYTGEKRENYVVITFQQKRCEELDGIGVGDLIEVSFVLNGRSYQKDGQTKYITDIIGYKVEKKKGAAPIQEPTAPVITPEPIQEPVKGNDELPF